MPYVTNAPEGAYLLDFTYIDWADEIDLDALDMSLGSFCVFGQLFGDYIDGRDHVFDYAVTSAEREQLAIDHGFSINTCQTWGELQREWEQLIQERKNDHG